MDAERLARGTVVFDGELALGVRAEVIHHSGTIVADVRQDLQEPVR